MGLEHLAEDKELEVSQVKAKFRHRLVGAVVLVAALATVLPIFFEEPAIQSDRHAETKIPPITKEPFYKMELPVNNRPAVSMPADQSALKDLSKPNVVKDAPEARPTPELDQKQKEAQTYAPSTEGSLYIQVLAGLPVYSVKVQKKSATLWRVRLGLFKTKEEAERVAKILDSRKISHMPVQVEESAKRDMNRIAPTRTLKSAAQEAHSRSQEQKAKTPAAQPAKAKSQPIKNATPAQPKAVKPATAAKTSQPVKKEAAKTSQPVKKETAPKATQKVSPKKSASDDPLADLLKSTREDVIAQKLRESGHK